MCTKHYCGYTLFAVLLIGWALQVEFRNDRFPQVHEVKVDTQGSLSQVQYLIANPNKEPVRVATHVRLQSAVDNQDGIDPFSSPITVEEFLLEPNSLLNVDLTVENVGLWSEADVQLFVLDNAHGINESQLDRLGRFATNRFQKLAE